MRVFALVLFAQAVMATSMVLSQYGSWWLATLPFSFYVGWQAAKLDRELRGGASL